ncbi:MAG: GNAT family N-acetyltransferase [Anaerolineales bacterium]|nr:GNAT family N-acetyltransferase [Anaerolineales bacterium]
MSGSAAGPRRARFPHDVPQITRLVELCFADVLDSSARRSLHDVRWIAELGGAAWSLSRLVGAVQPDEWVLGSVWTEAGSLVGNATITRRTPEAGAWLLSNVAVHPDFRRRGIARGLVRHAMDAVRAEGGRKIYLQVDAANESAARLYRELGFADIGGRISWTRARDSAGPAPAAPTSCKVSLRKDAEWGEEFALYREVTPDGTAWNVPLAAEAFRPSVGKRLRHLLEGRTVKHFLARGQGDALAALTMYERPTGWEGVLIQRAGTCGRVERALVDAAVQYRTPDGRAALETTPEASADVLIELGFQKRRTFQWMRYTFSGGVL